jgi:hypothetical protein
MRRKKSPIEDQIDRINKNTTGIFKRDKEYLFININPIHQIVVEIERRSSGLTEINTIFDSTPKELKRLEDKLPTIFSSGETPISHIRASP